MINKKQAIYTLEEFDCKMGGGRKFCTTISPAFKQNNVAISIIASNEYCPFAAVVVKSIITNATENYNYDIVVLTNDMYQRNIQRIERMQDEHTNISIRVLDISPMIKGFKFYTWAHFTSNTYYRLLTPDVFANYDKVIYLDSDIVVNHDIAELYNTDITGYYLGCAFDTHVVSYCTRNPPLEQKEYNKNKLGLEKPEVYFQAGVSLYNIKEIRKDFEPGYLLKQSLEHKLRWLDQDLINMLFQGRIKRLSNRWNVMVSNIPDNLDEYHLPKDLRKEYYDARQNPYIIHYVGRTMPCYTTTPDLYEYFWKYARTTEFYEIILQRISLDYAEKLKQSVIYEAQIGNLRLYPGTRLKIKHFILKFFPSNTKRREILDRFYLFLKKINFL